MSFCEKITIKKKVSTFVAKATVVIINASQVDSSDDQKCISFQKHFLKSCFSSSSLQHLDQFQMFTFVTNRHIFLKINIRNVR